MKVTIRQREEEYISDYPTGWKFSAGDPFKFPVSIGDNPCFVKRFEQKGPEDISGWDLLVKMRGVDQKNLSTILDIKNEQEDGKEIYYIFYQYLDGITLDKYLRQPGVDINLLHLKNDLFNALSTLQNYGFWFADFTEKNIFHQKDGSFVLVDVDSTHRISDLPENQMYGSKDYWILVLKFYKEILNKSNFRLSDINGINLNYLQIPFLVLRLKILLAGKKEDYNSTAGFNQLPAQLDKMAPEFRDFYLKVIDSGKEPLSKEEIDNIEDLVEKKIIKADYTPALSAGPASLPLIKQFEQSSNEIESGGSFTLSWVVENTNKLELYKNGALFKGLDLSQNDVSLKEFADGTRKESSYQLIAYNDLNMAKSEQKIIKLKEDPDPKIVGDSNGSGGTTRKWWIIAGVGLLAIAVVVYYFTRKPEVIIDPIVESTVLPVVNAGRDTSIALPNDKVLLEGTVTDSNNNAISASYSWTKLKGPSAEISSPNQATTMVRQLNQAGTYLFEFRATADKGATASDTLTVVVSAADNIAPKADAGENKSLVFLQTAKNEVTLSGKKSKDDDGHIAKYAWSKVAGPPTGGIVTPATVNEPTATVTGLQLGTYQYKLTVTDNKGATNESTVLVYVHTNKYKLPDNWKKIKTLEKIRVTPLQ